MKTASKIPTNDQQYQVIDLTAIVPSKTNPNPSIP